MHRPVLHSDSFFVSELLLKHNLNWRPIIKRGKGQSMQRSYFSAGRIRT